MPRTRTPPFVGAPRVPAAFPGDQKYAICPASGHLHEPRAMRLYPTTKKAWPAFVCGCGVKGFASSRFDVATQGLTEAQLQQRGVPTESTPIRKKPPSGRGERYVLCPFAFDLHSGAHAVLVQKGPKAYHCQCSCGSNWFLGRHTVKSRWTDKHGYTLEQVVAMGATADG